MQWALLAVIVVALFLLSGRYPKLAFGIFAAMVVAVAGVLFLGQDEATLRKAKISPADITVENTAGAPAYGGGYRLTGRIKNNHADAELKEVVLSIVMQDCGDSGCQAVGQTDEQVNLRVPAGQARDFSVTVYLGEPEISGTIGWAFTVTETRS